MIELVVGVGIVAFVLCGSVSCLFNVITLSEIARDKTVAVNDAQKVMEQIVATSFSSITSVDWTSWAEDNGCNTLDNEQVNVAFAYPEELEEDPLDIAEELLQITVTVTWQTRNKPLSVSLVTLRKKPGS